MTVGTRSWGTGASLGRAAWDGSVVQPVGCAIFWTTATRMCNHVVAPGDARPGRTGETPDDTGPDRPGARDHGLPRGRLGGSHRPGAPRRLARGRRRPRAAA